MDFLTSQIDFTQTSLHNALLITALIPTCWNIVARLEYYYQAMSRLFPSRLIACYFLAASIFFSSLYRDYLFNLAIDDQPQWPALEFLAYPAIAMGLVGNVLVLSSMYKLGVTGTYLGDYFGIYMSERVESFPFNVMSDPMYTGATMIFLATAIYRQSVAGIFMSSFIFTVYQIALALEGPFTTYIYAQKELREKKGKKKQ